LQINSFDRPTITDVAGLQTVPLVPDNGVKNKNKPVDEVLIRQRPKDEQFISFHL
jgi:hypothetical protein